MLTVARCGCCDCWVACYVADDGTGWEVERACPLEAARDAIREAMKGTP